MRIPFIPILIAASTLCAACGVRFSDASGHNEFFRSLVVTGQTRTNTPLTVAVSYQTTYNVPVLIVCELRQGKITVQEIGRNEVPAGHDGTPKAKPVPGNFSYDFEVEHPGSYRVQCYTERDADNYITRAFTVRQQQ